MPTQDQSTDNEGMDLRELLTQLIAKKWWLFCSTAAGTIAAVAAIFLIAPVYRATVVVIPAGTDRAAGGLSSALGQLGGLAALAGVNIGGGTAGTEEAIAVLRSRQFTESFVRDLNLLPVLFPKKWDAVRQRWTVDESRRPTLGDGFREFDKKIRWVDQDKKTGLVSLQIDWTDRDVGAAWANEFVARANAEMRRRAIVNAEASVQYLETELRATTVVETREAINRIIEAQVKQRMIASVTPEYAFRVVDVALPADRDDPVWPKKPLLLALGVIGGLAIGVCLVSLRRFFAATVITTEGRQES